MKKQALALFWIGKFAIYVHATGLRMYLVEVRVLAASKATCSSAQRT